MTDDELIAAWERWDQFPGSRHAVVALEDAIYDFTDDRLEFRRFIADRRRERLARQLILDLWRERHD